MSLINVSKISFSWDYGDRPVFMDISFALNAGEKVGLIGPNGCGKSTLLNLVSGELQPNEGQIIRSGGRMEMGHLPQQTEMGSSEDIYSFAYSSRPDLLDLQTKADAGDAGASLEFGDQGGFQFRAGLEKTLTAFGFAKEQWLKPLKELSSGQRTRVYLARTLLSRPEILLLDEPTNHLDLNGLEFLENQLQSFKGTVLVVSHDRYFLNRTVGRILELRRGRLEDYPGNYDAYLSLRQAREERQWEEYHRHNKEIRKLESEASARMAWSQRTERGWKREPGEKQPDDRTKRYAKKMAKRAKAVRTKIEQKIEREKAEKPFVEKKVKLKFPGIDALNGYALTVEELSKRYSDKNIFSGFSLSLHSGERVVIRGPNGCGKSTLMKILASEVIPDGGDFRWAKRTILGYYPQEQVLLDPKATALEEVMKSGCETEQAWTFLGALFLREDYVLKPTSMFSAGERAKIILARLLLSGANVLLLDEPTNHLDIDSREALEKALTLYTGTILMVTHDRYLIGKLATRVISFDKAI